MHDRLELGHDDTLLLNLQFLAKTVVWNHLLFAHSALDLIRTHLNNLGLRQHHVLLLINGIRRDFMGLISIICPVLVRVLFPNKVWLSFIVQLEL